MLWILKQWWKLVACKTPAKFGIARQSFWYYLNGKTMPKVTLKQIGDWWYIYGENGIHPFSLRSFQSERDASSFCEICGWEVVGE